MLIGLTGGIGSGKSTIAAELRKLGYPVYDSDREAKRIMTDNPVVRSQIEYLFGSDVYDGDVYQSRKVAALVFEQPHLLRQLNQVVHPAVCYDVKHWARMERERGCEVCFVESAILYESGLAEACDAIVLVTAPLEIRVERTMQRDGATREAVEKRIAAQMKDCECLARANYIINNDGAEKVEVLTENMLHNIKKGLA